MYTNRISRTAPKSTSNTQPQFSIHSEIAIDERVRYIESVCSTLIESRFGPGFIFESFPNLIGHSQPPEFLSPVFYDLLDDDEMFPNDFLSHLSFLGRIAQIGDQRFDITLGTQDLSVKEMWLLNSSPTAHNSTATLTPNHGRGSP